MENFIYINKFVCYVIESCQKLKYALRINLKKKSGPNKFDNAKHLRWSLDKKMYLPLIQTIHRHDQYFKFYLTNLAKKKVLDKGVVSVELYKIIGKIHCWFHQISPRNCPKNTYLCHLGCICHIVINKNTFCTSSY